jgi:transmembrane sensor
MPAASSPRTLPLAGGRPISETVADEAAEWLTVLMSGEATPDDHLRLQHWRDAHPDHERAWQHIEVVTGRLKMLEHSAAYRTLSPFPAGAGAGSAAASPARRRALAVLLWGTALGAAGVMTSKTRAFQTATADYHTQTGEQRTVALSDGTHILLNTASAIDVRFDGRLRRIRLIAGEMMVATGHRETNGVADARPFVVDTDEGRIRALGTRFTVRQEDGRTAVAVLQSAVEIRPLDASGTPLVLHEGQRTTFTRSATGTPASAGEHDAAWLRGHIVADNVRLGDFLDDLSRYRPGILRCDPAVAGLRFSGVFPLGDTDRILDTLPVVLPVEVKLRTRYWVTVTAKT